MIKKFLLACALALGLLSGAMQANAQWSPGPGVSAEPIGHITVYGQLEASSEGVLYFTPVNGYSNFNQVYEDPVYVVALVVTEVRAKCYGAGAGITKNTSPSERAAAAHSIISQVSPGFQRLDGLYTNVRITWPDGSLETFAYNLWSVNSIEFSPGSGDANSSLGACTG